MTEHNEVEVPQQLVDAIMTGDCRRVAKAVDRIEGLHRAQVLGLAMKAAILHGSIDVLSFLHKAGAYPNVQDRKDESPLHWVVRGGTAPMVTVLIEHGARPDIRNFMSHTPLHDAADFGKLPLVQALLANGVSADGDDPTGVTALTVAAGAGHAAVMKALIRAGADPRQIARRRGRPIDGPLHRAVIAGRVDCVTLLLKHGADPLARGEYGKSAIKLASENGRPDLLATLETFAGPGGQATTEERAVAQTLAESGSKIKTDDPYERRRMERALSGSPLHDAAILGEAERLQSLLDDGHLPDERDRYGFCAMHKAAQFGHIEVVRILIAAGAAVDSIANTRNGAAPLYYAAGYGQPEIVALLLEEGADRLKLDRWGKTPLDWALSPTAPKAVRELNQACSKLLKVP